MKKMFFIIITLHLCESAFSQSYNGSIIRVIDGDTFVFQTKDGSLKVRMYGTDAPERDQPFSKESADFLKKYFNKDATFNSNGIERYRRWVGTLYLDGQDINLLTIKNGCAWLFIRYSSDLQYASAEESARMIKIGLWALPNPIPPWEWRKNEK